MRYALLRTEHANDQLVDLLRYTAELSQSYDTALSLLERIERGLEILTSAPHSGSYPRFRHLKRQGYRVLIVEKILIFYKCDDEKRTVTVYHRVDFRTNYGAYLK